MKPFSPLYFIKENKARCILLMFMIFLSYAAYLGGLYVSNPMDNWQLAISYYDDFAQIYPDSEDEDWSEFEALKDELKKNEKVTVIDCGKYGGFVWESVMGFTIGTVSFAFQTPEDFLTYCEYMDIECDFESVKPGSIIMSELFANNLGFELGKKINSSNSDYIYGEYTLDALTKENGYITYLINNEPSDSICSLVLGNGISGDEVYDIVYDARTRNNVDIYDMIEEEVRPQFESFNIIYTFIVILLSVILAVTINAAFVGMYQRRNFEFAVYRAIGISKRKITGKIIGEFLIIDLIALILGGIVFFLAIYLLNNLVLYPEGKYLRYINPIAVFGLLLCNVTVIVPLIITRCRQLLKADICDY